MTPPTTGPTMDFFFGGATIGIGVCVEVLKGVEKGGIVEDDVVELSDGVVVVVGDVEVVVGRVTRILMSVILSMDRVEVTYGVTLADSIASDRMSWLAGFGTV